MVGSIFGALTMVPVARGQTTGVTNHYKMAGYEGNDTIYMSTGVDGLPGIQYNFTPEYVFANQSGSSNNVDVNNSAILGFGTPLIDAAHAYPSFEFYQNGALIVQYGVTVATGTNQTIVSNSNIQGPSEGYGTVNEQISEQVSVASVTNISGNTIPTNYIAGLNVTQNYISLNPDLERML